jgi:hypothetical protein
LAERIDPPLCVRLMGFPDNLPNLARQKAAGRQYPTRGSSDVLLRAACKRPITFDILI